MSAPHCRLSTSKRNAYIRKKCFLQFTLQWQTHSICKTTPLDTHLSKMRGIVFWENLLLTLDGWSDEEYWQSKRRKVKNQDQFLNLVKTPVFGWWSFFKWTGLRQQVQRKVPNSMASGKELLYYMIQSRIVKRIWLLGSLVSLFLCFTLLRHTIYHLFS